MPPTFSLSPSLAVGGDVEEAPTSGFSEQAKANGRALLDSYAPIPMPEIQMKAGGMVRKMSEGGPVNRYHSTIDDAINAEVKPPKPGSDLSRKFGMIKAIGRDAASMFDLKEGTTGTNTAMETTKQVAPVSPVVAGAGRGIASAASMAVNPYATTHLRWPP